ncbi:MAG: hypothetical protein K6A23_14185 [Butyrivibrio sp.]|nr:hypothetical protein [Butyrivibrio sp.]
MDVQKKRGDLSTFIIHVKFRQNATWQGDIVWREQNKKMHFRSALELMRMIDSAVEWTDHKTDDISTVS